MKAIIIVAALALSVTSAESKDCSVQPSLITASVKAKPVVADFGYFRVHRVQKDASLNWSVTDPTDVDYFLVERSYDGTYFETVTNVDATASTTYQFRDNPFPGTIYYRISMVTFSGRGVISTPVESLRIMARF